MIDTAHLRAPIAGVQGERSALIDQLAKKADVNRDGTLTNAEFATFLDGLTAPDAVQGLKSLGSTEVTALDSSKSAAAQAPNSAEPLLPGVAASPAAAAKALGRAIARTEGTK